MTVFIRLHFILNRAIRILHLNILFCVEKNSRHLKKTLHIEVFTYVVVKHRS